MKKKKLFKLDEKLKVLQELTNDESGQLKGGTEQDPTTGDFINPTPTPKITIKYSPPPPTPPVTVKYSPPDNINVGVTFKF